MNTLTVRNPQAAQIVFGMERAHTVKVATKYRGPVLIHAAGELNRKERTWDLPHEELLQCVIGMAELHEVERRNAGGYEWRFINAMVFPEPVSVYSRGESGLWELDGEDIVEQIQQAMRPAVAKEKLGYNRRLNEQITDSVHPRRRDGWVGD